MVADMPCQRPGVDAAQAHDVLLPEEGVQGDEFMGVGGLHAPFANNVSAGHQPGFANRVHTPVTDQRVGLHHNLTGIGGIHQQILIGGHVGVEHHLTHG